VHVEVVPALDIGFDSSAVTAAGKAVASVLADIYNHIATKILPPLNAFL